jgi:hypothetical protein
MYEGVRGVELVFLDDEKIANVPEPTPLSTEYLFTI